MSKLDKVIQGLKCCFSDGMNCDSCPYNDLCGYRPREEGILADTLELLNAQKDRHRLEVHNIGNIDIPEGVSKEHFHLVMNNVVEALQHTDKGESYPYEDTGR